MAKVIITDFDTMKSPQLLPVGRKNSRFMAETSVRQVSYFAFGKTVIHAKKQLVLVMERAMADAQKQADALDKAAESVYKQVMRA